MICLLVSLVSLAEFVDARFYRYPNASLPSGRDWMSAARATNKIYFVGGTSESLLWPSSTSALSDATVRFSVEMMRSNDYLVSALPLETVRCGAAGTSNDTHAFFAGGLVGRPSGYAYTDTLLTYNEKTRITPRLLAGVARGFASAVTIQTSLNAISVSLFAGGHDNSVFYNDVDVLDHKTDMITLARLSVARKDPAAGSGPKICCFLFFAYLFCSCSFAQWITTPCLRAARRFAVAARDSTARKTRSTSLTP